MLSDKELAEARADFEREVMEPGKVKVLRPSTSRTATGGTVTTYPDPVTVDPIAGRIAPMGVKALTVYAERLTEETGYVVTVPAGTVIRGEDRLHVDGVTYEVIGAALGRSWELHLQVPVKVLR